MPNFSFKYAKGLNHHHDGNKVIHYNEDWGSYSINYSNTWELSFETKKNYGVSVFHEIFRGSYDDSISLNKEELIVLRWGHNIGLSFFKRFSFKRFSVIPRIGTLWRNGYEVYSFAGVVHRFAYGVELKDIGLNVGFEIDYPIYKWISVFSQLEHTRFLILKSGELGIKDFYDGPTFNYTRLRLGIKVSPFKK